MGGRRRHISVEFEANLVYRARFKTAKDTQKNPAQKNKKEKNKSKGLVWLIGLKSQKRLAFSVITSMKPVLP